MKWFVILYLPILCISVFIFLRALLRFIKVKEFFGNTLPDNEKECINGFPNGFPRHPISDYYISARCRFFSPKEVVYEN